MSRIDAFRAYQNDIYLFSRDVIGVPLYEYQAEWAQYIMDVIASKRNETITVEMSRQSGKNQGGAVTEVALLARFALQDRSIVKTSPTYKPQTINSKMRFESMAKRVEQRLPFLKFKPSSGYMYKCGARQHPVSKRRSQRQRCRRYGFAAAFG
jgi:hypothetical protein